MMIKWSAQQGFNNIYRIHSFCMWWTKCDIAKRGARGQKFIAKRKRERELKIIIGIKWLFNKPNNDCRPENGVWQHKRHSRLILTIITSIIKVQAVLKRCYIVFGYFVCDNGRCVCASHRAKWYENPIFSFDKLFTNSASTSPSKAESDVATAFLDKSKFSFLRSWLLFKQDVCQSIQNTEWKRISFNSKSNWWWEIEF